MNTIVIQGLKISTTCRYIRFVEDKKFEIIENRITDVMEIKFRKGMTTGEISSYKVDVIADKELEQTNFIKIQNPITTINGMRIRLLSCQDFIFNQYLVSELEEFVMDYYEGGLTILVPKIKDADYDLYVDTIKHCPYIEVLDCEKCLIRNYYQVNLRKSSGGLESKNDFVFSIADRYDRYILNDVMVVSSFKNQLSSIIESYGMQLVRYPIDQEANTPNRVVYRITEYGVQTSHKTGYDSLKDTIQHKTTFEFELTCLDLDVFVDFRTRYQNLDLISNFTEFFTRDRNGIQVLSNVQWSTIPTDFNPDYPQDNQGNAGYSVTFNAEIRYYVIYDKIIRTIKDMIVQILHSDTIHTEGRLGDMVGIEATAELSIPAPDEILEEFEVKQNEEKQEVPEWQKLRGIS